MIISGRRKELQSKFDRCRHLLLERDEPEVPTSFNGLLDCLFDGARSGVPLFATPLGDIATPGVNVLRSCIALLEKQSQAAEQRLKDRKSVLLGRVSVLDGRAQMPSTSAEAFLKVAVRTEAGGFISSGSAIWCCLDFLDRGGVHTCFSP